MLGSACVYCELTQLIDLCGIIAWGLHLDGIFQCFVKCWGLLVMCQCELTQLTWTRLICVVASGIEAWSLCRDGLSMPMQAARFIIRPRTQEAFTFIRRVRSLGLVFLSVKKPNKIVDWINSFYRRFFGPWAHLLVWPFWSFVSICSSWTSKLASRFFRWWCCPLWQPVPAFKAQVQLQKMTIKRNGWMTSSNRFLR